MKYSILFVLAASLLGACGDDATSSPELVSICKNRCKKAVSCDVIGSSDTDDCRSICEEENRDVVDNAQCKFTQPEVDQCNAAVTGQGCSAFKAGTLPAQCRKVCYAN